MILFCKTIKFALEKAILREICFEIRKKSGKFAQKGQEKMLKRAKSQEKMKAI